MTIASSIIGGFRRYTTPVQRGSVPSVIDGRVQPGAVTTVQILCAIFPKKASRLMREEAGETRSGQIKVYSSDPIYAGRDTGEPADLIDWNGATYEVDEVDYYEDGGLYDATATRRRVT
jgi:hypothetical protein